MVISREINFDVYSSESLNATLAKPPFNITKLKTLVRAMSYARSDKEN